MGLFCFFYVVSIVYCALRILAGDYVNIALFVLYCVGAGAYVVGYLVGEIRRAYHDCIR